ncbi:unnamed protein product [Lepeophtheirus salmonis]|uniref:(salmon louse) hypothetical protein n=1 Tax=Lepeophtheirus salmonis TaxID=72036 RepID=A0A7R8CP08_LEPSM|nr:unnamed protein product [Lepeophtheirus salmonis]CAF2881870.1 unnamed protein product [Lepeophtheirus salmonis]
MQNPRILDSLAAKELNTLSILHAPEGADLFGLNENQRMAIEPDLSYSWLPPTSSTPSTMEEVDLANFTPTDLMSGPKAVKSSVPMDTIQLQEETFILTPVTQPFQIQLCVDQEYGDSGGGAEVGGDQSHAQQQSFSHLQEPLNDPMLPVNSKNNIEARKSIPGVINKSSGYSYLGSHFSPVSVHSLADSGVGSISETVSENTSERILNNAPATPNYLDIDFDQIVEDVDDMFQICLQSTFFTYTSKNPEELAHDLAKSLVEKALESERRKYLENELDANLDDIFENWAEIAANRGMESILNDLIGGAVNEMATSIFHTYNGDFVKFKDAANSTEKSKKYIPYDDALQEELDVLVSDILAESDENCLVSKKYGLYQIGGPSRVYDFRVPSSKQKVDEKAFMTRWKGYTSHVCTDECNRNRRIFITAKMRREAERKRRNRAGILLQERKIKGVPEPSDSIEVKELNVPENIFPKEGIPILKKNGRGRPRKYPRVEDFRRWFVAQEEKKKKNSQKKLGNAEEKDKSIDSKTKISYPSPSAEIVRIDNIVKKRPRGRPPKYQVSVQDNEPDNLKIKLSRKRPSRSTYSKVNYVDCDSSDEGYSESVKESFQDDKVYRKTYKRPAKRRRTTRTSKKSIPSSSPTVESSRASPECVFECLESAIKTATDNYNNSITVSPVPSKEEPEAISKDLVLPKSSSNVGKEHDSEESSNISEAVTASELPKESSPALSLPILESQTESFVYEKPETQDTISSVVLDENLTSVDNNVSISPESCATLTYSHSPSITKVSESSSQATCDPSASHYVIIQEVNSLVNNIFKPKMSETGMQTSGDYMDQSTNSTVSIGFQTMPREKNSSVLVSKSIQTNISVETNTERPSHIFQSNCSTQSISTSTDISVCTNTNELLHTMHLTGDSEILGHFVNSRAAGENKPKDVLCNSLIGGSKALDVSCTDKVDSEVREEHPQPSTNETTHEYDLTRSVNSDSDEAITIRELSNNSDEPDSIKTYSRKVLHSSPPSPSMDSFETKIVSESSTSSSSSSDSEQLLGMTTSSFDIVPLNPEMVNLDINEKDLTPSSSENFEKSLSMNEALKDDDEEEKSSTDIREPRSTSLILDDQSSIDPFYPSPSKSQKTKLEGDDDSSSQLALFPKVVLKRLRPEVIDSWCNRLPHFLKGSSSNGQKIEKKGGDGWNNELLVSLTIDCFKDEIYSTGESRVQSPTINTKKLSFFREDVDDSVVPHIPDEDILQASKSLPVYASIKKKKQKRNHT